MKRDSLAVERDEMLRMIEQIENVVTSLPNVDARTSKRYAEEVEQLRKNVQAAKSAPKWESVMQFAGDMLVRIAAEVFKAWL